MHEKRTVNIIIANVQSVAHQLSHRHASVHWLIASSMTAVADQMRQSCAASGQQRNLQNTI